MARIYGRFFLAGKTMALFVAETGGRSSRYYVFEVQSAATTKDLWLVPEGRWLAMGREKPFQLTSGPLWYSDPVFLPGGKSVFVNGVLLQGELVRYSTASGEFSSFISGVPSGEADFSPDGQWVAYVSYPELTLWRAHIDGTQKTQLTFWLRYASLPRWSADGKQMAFIGTGAGQSWKIYLISPQGGTPQELRPEDREENDASWSPDSNRIAYGRRSYGLELGGLDIEIYDRTTHQTYVIPGSHGLFSPRWSPDGRHLAALSTDSRSLMLYDFDASQWSVWLQTEDGTIGYPVWAKDGRSIYVERFLSAEPSMHQLKLGESQSKRFLSWGG